jgi:uncharacterized protein
MLYKRLISNDIEKNMNYFSVAIILGPRQVGKSTLAKHLVNYSKPYIYLDLEKPDDELKLSAPQIYLEAHTDSILVIDEVQRKPELFPLLRSLVDIYPESRYLLLGSASEDIIMKSSESLAGRSCYYEMQPLSIWEVGPDEMNQLWLRGGFPRAFLAENDDISMQWLNQFIKSYLERELSISYLKASPILLEKFLIMLTSVHGQLVNYSMLSGSMDLSLSTIKTYIEFFEQKYLIRIVYPFFINIGKRLVKSPKLYFRDSGILHHLSNIRDQETLESNIIKGASWEGFVIQQILSLISISVKAYFYRTSDGTELDLILMKGSNVIIGFEIKYSNSPKVSPGIHRVIQDLNIPLVLVVTPSSDEFPYKEKIRIAPLKNVINHLRQLKLTEY